VQHSVQESLAERIADDEPVGVPTDLIDGEVEGYRYFFNPRGHHGVLVFLGDALEVFECCTKVTTFAELKEALARRIDSQRLQRIFNALEKLEMAHLSKSSSCRPSNDQREKKRSMMVWFQLTDVCNLSCGYCYINRKPTHMNFDLAKALVEKIRNDCASAGFDEVVVKLAGGEPTLRWITAKSLIDWASGRFDSTPYVKFHIITNATALPTKLIDYLVAGKLSVAVSLDGVGQWHNKHRHYANGTGSFVDVNRNIETLISRGIRPYILTTITPDNAPGVTELAEYCIQRELGFRLSLLRDPAATASQLPADNATLIRELLRCYAWIESHLPSRSLYECHRFGDIDLRTPRIRNCGIGQGGMTITSDGECCLCQYEMSDPLGNAQNTDTISLLKNQTHYSLTENRVDRFPVCTSCGWRFVCGGGCPYLTKRHYGTFQHHSPYCDVYQAILPMLLRVHALQTIRQASPGKEVMR